MLRLSLEKYFEKLQREHHPKQNPRRLIGPWMDREVRAVKTAIEEAVKEAGYIGKKMPISGLTNQAIGNASEKFFVDQINPHLKGAIKAPTGCLGGYPDRVIHIKGKRYCMELKTTNSWKKRDSHRRVITSSPDRLLKLIENDEVDDPPAHLIGTVLYDKKQSTVTEFRVDFLEPEIVVDFRLEASTNQKLLSEDSHEPLIIK